MQLITILDDNKHNDDNDNYAIEICALPVCYAVCSCKSLPTFRHNYRSHLLFYFLSPEDGTKRLSRNVGNDLQLQAA